MPENALGLEQQTILVVDDTPENLSLMGDMLAPYYRVKVATNGERALKIAGGTNKPDLILLDVMMPGLSGYEVCEALKANPDTAEIPVIFLTALSNVEDEQRGLDAGAVDYVTKPISPPVVLARVKSHLRLKAASDQVKNQNVILERKVAERTAQLAAIQDVTILAMASLAETRDSDTGNHIRRTQNYVRELALALVDHPRFRDTMSPGFIDLLYKSAPLHDIGKVGIPDRILLKPGKLTVDEFEIMKTHAALGRQAIDHAESSLGTSVEFLVLAKEIAYGHHEKWDGSGYPQALKGDAIPVAARLMAIADVYDALISRRVYKDGMPHADAVEIVVKGRGTHFDPDMVDAFVAIQHEFQRIASEFADSDLELARKAEYYDQALAPSP